MYEYDLIIIGAGPGGTAAALQAAHYGKKTAIVEKAEIGGTCLNRGCIPTKALLHASTVYSEIQSAQSLGIDCSVAGVDLPGMFAYKNRIISTLAKGMEDSLKRAGIQAYYGRAEITDLHSVRICRNDGQIDSIQSERILIATGSAPLCPPIPGLDLDGVMTSDMILEGSENLYSSVVIIGGGVIGCEFATFYSNLGVPVTILEGASHLLPNMDRELGQNLALLLKKKGVNIHTGAMVQRIEKGINGLDVVYASENDEKKICGEKVLCAIGRRPYYDSLFSKDFPLSVSGRSIPVDENYSTAIPGIYAIGDVSSRIQLAHAASAQGIAAVDHMFGNDLPANPQLIPSVVYCSPEIAAVGLSEKEASESGISVVTGKAVLGANGRALILNSGRSFMKLVANTESHEILGAQFMCANASDIISELTLAIQNHITAEKLLAVIRPHPTFEEALNGALEQLLTKLSK